MAFSIEEQAAAFDELGILFTSIQKALAARDIEKAKRLATEGVFAAGGYETDCQAEQ